MAFLKNDYIFFMKTIIFKNSILDLFKKKKKIDDIKSKSFKFIGITTLL